MGKSMKGIVKWFSNKKGYGFITGEDQKDVFVHFSGINMDGYKLLKENQVVEFEVISTGKGTQAVNVTTIVNLNEDKAEVETTETSE